MSRALSDYNYAFNESQIALHPVARREDSRLMVLGRQHQTIAHKNFCDIAQYFVPGDVLVLNDTKVFPCRLVTTRQTGGRQEILLLNSLEPLPDAQNAPPRHQNWRVLLNASKKIKTGDVFEFPGLRVTIVSGDGNERTARLDYEGALMDVLAQNADMPLPPYIRRSNVTEDRQRYQTVFARDSGSVAAPTAGLHFTLELLETLRQRGVIVVTLTLHVGPGTFLPVRTLDITQHRMHTERYAISPQACDAINAAKSEGRRVTTVGTTSTRVLESLAQTRAEIKAGQGETDIFIYPPFRFKIVDRLITNFHQPESTLLMLVSAFAGREFVLNAYAQAVSANYRLFSYGDAMLIQ